MEPASEKVIPVVMFLLLLRQWQFPPSLYQLQALLVCALQVLWQQNHQLAWEFLSSAPILNNQPSVMSSYHETLITDRCHLCLRVLIHILFNSMIIYHKLRIDPFTICPSNNYVEKMIKRQVHHSAHHTTVWSAECCTSLSSGLYL